jgi:hypothetical protein
MDNKISKHFAKGFKNFTGLDPTYADYMRNPTMFDGSLSFYDKYPILSWIIIIAVIAYAICGCIVVLNA